MPNTSRLLPEHIVCKITQRDNIRRANPGDPALVRTTNIAPTRRRNTQQQTNRQNHQHCTHNATQHPTTNEPSEPPTLHPQGDATPNNKRTVRTTNSPILQAIAQVYTLTQNSQKNKLKYLE